MQLAFRQMEAKPLKIEPSYDIWQLGVMVYEAMVGPYWPEAATEASILHQLATDTTPLPHQKSPPEPKNVASMLEVRRSSLMQRIRNAGCAAIFCFTCAVELACLRQQAVCHTLQGGFPSIEPQ